MRVIAGAWKGRTLHVPRDAAFRPTTDRVKEAVFNILAGIVSWPQTRVCDLYAGSGGLGLEALSRGAAAVTFVERSPQSINVLQRNIEALAASTVSNVRRQDVRQFCRRSEQQFNVVFADPPYASFSADELLEGIVALLLPDGIAVVEHGGMQPFHACEGLRQIDERQYGSTTITIFQSSDRGAS